MHGELTAEQKELLSHAANGHVLVTAVGSPNDILWGQLDDMGLMEPADLPEVMAMANFHAWRLTEAGLRSLSAKGGSRDG